MSFSFLGIVKTSPASLPHSQNVQLDSTNGIKLLSRDSGQNSTSSSPSNKFPDIIKNGPLTGILIPHSSSHNAEVDKKGNKSVAFPEDLKSAVRQYLALPSFSEPAIALAQMV